MVKIVIVNSVVFLIALTVTPAKLFSSFLGSTIYQKKSYSKLKFLNRLRGGSTNVSPNDDNEGADQPSQTGCSSIAIVSTSIGSSFLDKKKKIVISADSTILDLKTQLYKKFPGSPPVAIQKLILGMREVTDTEIIGNLTTTSPIPLMLDIISGTSAYNKTMTVSQALEAYASLTVHQAYLGDQLKQLYSHKITSSNVIENNNNNNKEKNELEKQISMDNGQEESIAIIETITYRDMLESINATLYSSYSEDILEALEEEKEPEVQTADTLAWRTGGAGAPKKPLAAALAKEFDLNAKSLIEFVYYSFLLGIFAWFGTTTELSSQFLLYMVPVLWISKLRQLRLLCKLLSYMVLPVLPKLNFLMPLLPAPYQVIALESQHWSDTEEDAAEVEDRLSEGSVAGDLDSIRKKLDMLEVTLESEEEDVVKDSPEDEEDAEVEAEDEEVEDYLDEGDED